MSSKLTARGLKTYATHVLQLAEHRLLRHKLSDNRFIVFGRGRSGTTTLVSLLNAHPQILCEGEILSRPVFLPLDHVLAHCANSGAAVYGCKILSYQLSEVQPIQQRSAFVHLLHDHGFRIIYLRRQDLLRHALSNMRAREYGFHAKTTDTVTAAPIVVQPDELMHWLHGSASLAVFETASLQDVPHLSLTYEDNLADEATHQATANGISDYLGLAPATVTSSYRKVSPVSLRESIANYDAVAQALQGTPFAVFLD